MWTYPKTTWSRKLEAPNEVPCATPPQLSVPRQTAVSPTLAGEIMMRYCQQHYLGEKFDQPYLCSHGVLGVEGKHSNVLNAAQ
jgi:hypothetical protein